MKISRKSSEIIPHECIIKLLAIYDSLKKAERRAADLLLEQPEFLANASIAEAAKAAGCSEPTLIRLAKRLDYEGYSDLKRNLGKPNNERAFWFHEGIKAGDTFDDTIEKLYRCAVQGLQDTFSVIDRDGLDRTVDMILNTRVCITYGVGDSAIMARFLQYNLVKMGLMCLFSEDVDFTASTAFHLRKGDAFFAISHSGMSDSTIRMAGRAKMCGANVICITNYPNSPLAKLSDETLLTAVFTEHQYSVNASKRIAEMCILEVIIANIILRGKDRLYNYVEEEPPDLVPDGQTPADAEEPDGRR